jgi:hypothetical protein
MFRFGVLVLVALTFASMSTLYLQNYQGQNQHIRGLRQKSEELLTRKIKQGIKHAKQNHRETKTDIENLNRLHNEQQGKLTTTM